MSPMNQEGRSIVSPNHRYKSIRRFCQDRRAGIMGETNNREEYTIVKKVVLMLMAMALGRKAGMSKPSLPHRNNHAYMEMSYRRNVSPSYIPV